MNKKEKELEIKEKKLEEEVRHMEEVEYGLKELLHGLIMGVIIGFLLAWFLLR